MDCIKKEKLNIILLIDTSKSMQGKRIKEVEQAILDIQNYLKELQYENSNVDFFLTLIQFATDACLYKNTKEVNIDNFKFDGIKCYGYSNLHLGYNLLIKLLRRESDGGIMPDFAGAAPIILLLTDGHPTGNKYKDSLAKLVEISWFKSALRYGIAVGLDDKRTTQVLKAFVQESGDVITCYKAEMLKDIIKIIIMTASKSRSTSLDVATGPNVPQNQIVKQLIADALSDTEGWTW